GREVLLRVAVTGLSFEMRTSGRVCRSAGWVKSVVVARARRRRSTALPILCLGFLDRTRFFGRILEVTGLEQIDASGLGQGDDGDDADDPDQGEEEPGAQCASGAVDEPGQRVGCCPGEECGGERIGD